MPYNCHFVLLSYLPTPRVQKPGDKSKNVQSRSHIYLPTFFFFGFHFFQCYNSTLPTKLMDQKCKRATVGSSREIWCSNRETGRFHEKLGDSRENRESWQVCIIVCYVKQLVGIHFKTKLPESKETTMFLVDFVPSTLKPLGTPLTLLTPCIQPTALAKGVRILREFARAVGGLLITT